MIDIKKIYNKISKDILVLSYADMFLLSIDLTYTVAMVTENGFQKRLQYKECILEQKKYMH